VNSNLQEQAWKYFELHANQRLTIFNFYIALCSAITAGLVASYSKDFLHPIVRSLFSILLILFSFVFWKLDERVKLLIKNAEAALKFFEEQDSNQTLVTHVFRREEILTQEERAKRWHPSYAKCFGMVFSVFALVGAGNLIWQLSALIHC
jgi:hypothetical protein